ncbi:MAG: hypothetical protein GYA17_19195, partial [Chloroflexi bacterium]|nr:hypothetical protein [Chloroflexota bacterium]
MHIDPCPKIPTRYTKAGRKDLRRIMVQADDVAVQYHPFWKKELEKLKFRLGRSMVIARKLLVAAWFILTKAVAGRHADEKNVAASFHQS